tara:strand:- start:3547 stop:3993 length:447 start_codon:yes stop_codon:yes gene_type:complete
MATLRVFSGATTYVRWQNYYVNTSLSFLSQTWEFFPFEFGGISESAAPGGNELTISVPATSTVISAFSEAQASLSLCEVTLYEFSAYDSQSVAPTTYTVVASHLGQVLDLGGSFIDLQIGLGTVLSPVGSQVPPRTYSTSLIGSPLRQ